MTQKAKKVRKTEKNQWASHTFSGTLVICFTAFCLLSSFNKNDVTALVKAKKIPIAKGTFLNVPQEPVIYTIRFGFESTDITPEAAVILKELIKMLKADKTLKVNIEGHADKFYDENYNLKISAKRANNVRKYLLAHNIAQNRITTASFGSSQPDPKNIHMPWLDRRVVITVNKN